VIQVMINDFLNEFARYRATGLKAIAQVPEGKLNEAIGPDGNSVATLVRHVSGNLISRFTDFLTSDGEKPWRNRDSEFAPQQRSRNELEELWAKGFAVVERELGVLTDLDLDRQIYIRGEAWRIHGALARSIAHISYHTGQIVLLARILCSGEWQWISVPKGKSGDYNLNPTKERMP